MRRSRREDLIARLQSRGDLVDRVRRALDVVATDDEAVRVVAEALDAELEGRVHLVVAQATRPALPRGDDPLVRVGDGIDAESCVAFQRPVTAVTASSAAFDACAHLRTAPDAVSGVCVPIAHGGDVAGVLQWQGPVGHPLDEVSISAVETVAHLLGVHLAVLRGGREDETPRTDPLTGLLNRRSTGAAIRELVRDLVPFSLALCNIDGFDAYNEAHGHDVGDRALRLFSRALTSTLRPDDPAGRIGGDVFAVAFPQTSAIDAAHALERVRETLVLQLAINDVPPFTVSCGVSDSNQGDSIEAIIETAELAVALAKRSGANRVMIAGEGTTHLPGDAPG